MLEIKEKPVTAVDQGAFSKRVSRSSQVPGVVAQLNAMIASQHTWSYQKWSEAAEAVLDHLEETPEQWKSSVPTESDANGVYLPQPHQFTVGLNPDFKEFVTSKDTSKEDAEEYLARFEHLRAQKNEELQQKVREREKVALTGANDPHQSLSQSASYQAIYEQVKAALELAESERADPAVLEILRKKKQHAFEKAQKKGETHHTQ